MATSATFMLVQAGHRVEIATTIGRLINALDDLEADPDLEPPATTNHHSVGPT